MTAVLRDDLVRRLKLCSLDELRILARLLERLELGRQRYGALDLSLPRPWRRELSEELLDAVVYDTIEQIRAEDLRHANLQAAADEEARELARWQAMDQRTTVSTVPAAIAATPEAVPEPVVEWEAGEGPRSTRGRR